MLDSFSGPVSELSLSLLLLVVPREEDLAEFFLDEDGKTSSSDSELLDEDDSAEEVSSLSDSLLVDKIELVSVSKKGLYTRFTVSIIFPRKLPLKYVSIGRMFR